jgi:polysaccharide export outer membrane protein
MPKKLPMKTITPAVVQEFKTTFARRFRATISMLALMLAVFLAGCQTQSAGVNGVEGASSLPTEPVALREGDTLKISFPGAPNLDTTQQIRADGKIVLPVLGELTAAGMTPAGLEKELVNRYSSQLLSKEVTVAVESSPLVVYVNGAVLRPGKISSNRPLSALEAIMEAGGFDYAKANQEAVKVIRHENGQAKSYTVNLKLEMQGKKSGGFRLKPSDIVFVPEKFVWF